MNFLNKEKDNIITIVKSLRPINYLYSKQNKDYDKFFRSSSLKGLIKSLNSHPKYNEFLKPGESLEEMKSNKNNTILDINFKSTFNYIEELSNLKNLPMVLLNKKLYKNGRFNNDYEESPLNSKEKRKKYKEKEKKEKSLRISQIKNSGDIDVTLDPGRYHPNYNFIKRRYPCAYLGKPKAKEDSFSKDLNQNDEKKDKGNDKDKDKEQNKNNDNNNSNNEDNTDDEKSKGKKTRNKNSFETTSNRIGNYSEKNKTKKMNFSSPNFYSMPKNKQGNKQKVLNELKQSKDKSLNKIKDHNTVSSWTHSMDLDKSKKNNDNNNIKISTNDKSKTNYNYYISQRMTNSTKFMSKNKKKLSKNSSAESLRCPIIFDKMPGRDRPINFVDGRWEGCRTNYNPDYNIIRPHVRTTIFKCKRKYQNFKRYITGKIIRSYCYSPDKYFVFEIKENKENDVSGKYGTIILKS